MWDNKSVWLNRRIPIFGPWCLFPKAFRDFHATDNMGLSGLSAADPGTKHATMSSLRWSEVLSVLKAI